MLIFILLSLIGCTSDENPNLNAEMKNLKEKNHQLENINKQLEEEMKDKQDIILELEQNDSVFETELNILDEGFYLNAERAIRDELSIQKIIKMFGEPKSMDEYVEEAHCGCQETKLTYENASFTFQGELLKWFTIKNPDIVTQRGISVGSTKKQVMEAYGENFLINQDGIQYGEKTGISFTIKEDIVSEISIWYMYE